MTDSEYYTLQFYTWEYRTRGIHYEDYPVALEPPYIPFIRHRPKQYVRDEGKRHTFISKFIDNLNGKKQNESIEEEALDYDSIEAFADEGRIEKVVFMLHIGKERKVEQDSIKALLTMLSTAQQSIAFEIIGDSKSIALQFVCSYDDEAMVEAILAAYLPTITIHKRYDTQEDILQVNQYTSVISFVLQEETIRPLAVYEPKQIDSLTALFGVLDSLKNEERLGIQILFTGCMNNWTSSLLHSATDYDGSSFFADTPKAPKLAEQKVQSPLLAVSVKAFVQANSQGQRETLLTNFASSIIQASKSPYNSLQPIVEDNADEIIQDLYCRTSHRTGMLLNANELANLVHIPSIHIQSKKLQQETRKTKKVSSIAMGKTYVLGINEHNQTSIPVTLNNEERLKHTHIIGATGTGKSTLLANLILQDIQQGNGITLLDPHGDLVDDIIARLPTHRIDDVVLLDPSDSSYPIGLNILQAHNDMEKEILSSDLVASFRKFATSWGDQMNTVLGNAIIAILESSQGGTLHDLRRFLIEQEYRKEYLQTVTDPSIKYYWLKEYPLLKSNSIGSILTRLDTFLRPKVIRNMVVQQQGLNFEQLLNTNKIVLVKLSQGLIGKENSYLLGSLIVSKLHQAAFARQQLQIRNPYYIYIDEFQNFITPSITEMLSGVRKYNVGLILSHQDLQQLQREDNELVNSILGNIYTRIVFRIGEPDAKKLQDGLSDFDYTDLQNLGRGEAVVRIEQPQYDCSLTTIPLESITATTKEENYAKVLEYTRANYATPKEKVEAMLLANLGIDVQEEKVVKPSETKEKNTIESVTAKDESNSIDEVIANDTIPTETITNTELQEQATPPKPSSKDRNTTHIYLQNLVKKMAEANGYIATIEAVIDNGQVDVLLTKNKQTIAIEICHTTDAEWEVHNIQKCINNSFDMIISLSGDMKQLDKIQKKCNEIIEAFNTYNVQFFTPDILFEYLAQSNATQEPQPEEKTMKGYRVSVQYDTTTQEEMKRKRASVAQVVMSSLRKKKK